MQVFHHRFQTSGNAFIDLLRGVLSGVNLNYGSTAVAKGLLRSDKIVISCFEAFSTAK